MQADSDALRRSAGSQPMGLPIGYGFTHDFALCRSAGAVRHFHRLRHAFSVQMVWYLSLTYGQAHRLSSGTPSACLFYTQKIRNGAAHTLFDSFATPPSHEKSLEWDFSAKHRSQANRENTSFGFLSPSAASAISAVVRPVRTSAEVKPFRLAPRISLVSRSPTPTISSGRVPSGIPR